MPALPVELYNRCISVLSRCGEFQSPHELRDLFTAVRDLASLRHHLPTNAGSAAALVRATVGLLLRDEFQPAGGGRPPLLVLVDVLREGYEPTFALRSELDALYESLGYLAGGGYADGLAVDQRGQRAAGAATAGTSSWDAAGASANPQTAGTEWNIEAVDAARDNYIGSTITNNYYGTTPDARRSGAADGGGVPRGAAGTVPDQLSLKQRQDLHEALASAFPSYSALQQMLYFQVGKDLAAISAPAPLPAVIQAIVQGAEVGGWLEVLLRGAREANAGNRKLKAFVEQFGL